MRLRIWYCLCACRPSIPASYRLTRVGDWVSIPTAAPPNPCPRSPRSTWAKGQSYASVPGETGLVQNVGKNRTKRLELGRWKGSSQREPEIRDQGFRHSRNPVLADGTATKSREELDPNGGSYRADFGLSGQPRYSVRRYLISAALPATLRRGPASQGVPLSLSTR